MAQTVGVAPGWPICCMATVIEAVLGLGCTMEINDDLQTSRSRPVDCSVEILSCTSGIGAPGLYVARESSV